MLGAWAESDRERHVARGIDQQARLAEVADASAGLERAGRDLAARFARVLHDVAAPAPGELA